MKRLALAALLCLASILPAAAQTYYDIDVDLPAYPDMAPIPESPVYYAPYVDSNYFFYDGLFWDFAGDNWYASPWYNGPWTYVEPIYVPTYVLWVPIHYYRKPPHYFHRWHANRPPRWAEHWGRDWQNRHNAIYSDQNANPMARAPLPAYQRNYPRGNYPRGAQQNVIHAQNYQYQPGGTVARQHYQSRGIAVPQARTSSPPPGSPQPAARSAPSDQAIGGRR